MRIFLRAHNKTKCWRQNRESEPFQGVTEVKLFENSNLSSKCISPKHFQDRYQATCNKSPWVIAEVPGKSEHREQCLSSPAGEETAYAVKGYLSV